MFQSGVATLTFMSLKIILFDDMKENLDAVLSALQLELAAMAACRRLWLGPVRRKMERLKTELDWT